MIESHHFGTMPNGTDVQCIRLCNTQGMKIDILTLGCIIQRWLVPCADAEAVDIVLGFDDLESYLADDSYLGAVVGRYANRIAHGRFSLGGRDYQVDVNQGGNCLHGGHRGFNSYVWQVVEQLDKSEPSVTLAMLSPDGDQGFPGELAVKVKYSLSDSNCLRVEYFANCNHDTLFNPTQHTYFNLAGHASGDIRQHQLQVCASNYTPSNEHGIPSGELVCVGNSPFDLRELHEISKGIDSDHPQILLGNGYDHNWCLDKYKPGNTQASFAALAVEPTSGRKLRLRTTMPGLQVYTGNYLSDTVVRKEGFKYGQNHGFCFESQFYPDAPNQPSFPSPVLRANEAFYSCSEYKVEG